MKYCLFLVLLLVGCKSEFKQVHREIVLNDAANSSLPSLNILNDGTILLSYVQDFQDTSKLFLTKIFPDSTQTKTLIDQGNDWFVNWADYPITHVFPNEDQLLFHWLEKSTSDTYDYDIICRKYDLEQDSIGYPFKLNDAIVPSEYGFVSSTPFKDGLQMMWLDGRHTKEKNGAMNLRTTFLPRHGSRKVSTLLDDRVCDCCQTSLLASQDKLYGFYRDRNHDEVRDISMVRFDQTWQNPQAYSKDNWKIAGCPVNGPRSDVFGHIIAMVWHTQSGDRPKNYVSFYDTEKESEINRFLISDDATLGRLDVKMIDQDNCGVVWLDAQDDRSYLKYANFNIDSGKSDTRLLNENLNTRSVGFPQLAIHDGSVYFAFTDQLNFGKVRLYQMN